MVFVAHWKKFPPEKMSIYNHNLKIIPGILENNHEQINSTNGFLGVAYPLDIHV